MFDGKGVVWQTGTRDRHVFAVVRRRIAGIDLRLVLPLSLYSDLGAVAGGFPDDGEARDAGLSRRGLGLLRVEFPGAEGIIGSR